MSGSGGSVIVAGNGGVGGAVIGPPSCRELPRTCGPNLSGDCCASSPLPNGTFNRFRNPSYPATLSAFRLDNFEVTVGRFRKFLSAYPGNKPVAGSGKNPNDATDPGWKQEWSFAPYLLSHGEITTALKACGEFSSWTDTPLDNENRPLGCVSWYEAFAFCIADGGRLPTEAEWSYAATGGSEQRVYPWSSPSQSTVIDATYASYRTQNNQCLGDGQPECTIADLVRVGTKPNGNGRWGHAELGGNIFEMTRDTDTTMAMTCVNCSRYDDATTRIILGGSYSWDVGYIDTSTRRNTQAIDRWADLGFRCARNP
jgi:formylglycine-generating enzyme required for sulfatase activity